MTRGAAIALLAFVVVAGAACDDDASHSQTPPSDKEVREGILEQRDAEIFMGLDASPAQIDAVRARLEKSGDVDRFAFLSEQDAYDEFERLFADRPELIQDTDPADLPTSFRAVLARNGDRRRFEMTFDAMAGVDTIVFPRGPARRAAAVRSDPRSVASRDLHGARCR